MRTCTALLLTIFCLSTTGCDVPDDPTLAITAVTHKKATGTFTIVSTGPPNSTATVFVATAVNGTQINHISSLMETSVATVINYDDYGVGTVTISTSWSGPYIIGVTKDNLKSCSRIPYND